jgi:hypothetical protein
MNQSVATSRTETRMGDRFIMANRLIGGARTGIGAFGSA